MRLASGTLIIVLACTAAALAQDNPKACPQVGSDFAPIFDGKTLTGWHISTKSPHGATKAWVVKDGAITGTQDTPGNGGILLTDEPYGDVEISLEIGNDYGPDSGLFLRSTEDGKCYQAMIDYHDNGNVMGVYGEGIGGFVARNFLTHESPDQITILDCPAVPLPGHARAVEDLLEEGLEPGAGPHHGQPAAESKRGSTASSSWTGRTPRNACPTRAASGFRSTAAAI